MGKSQELSVKLTSGEAYFPGQTVSGIVTATLDKPRECQRLELHWMGTGSVGWSEQHRGYTTFCPAEEEYLNKVVVLKEPEEGDEKLKLEAGVSIFPFSFILPSSLPASFNCEYGRVTYTLTASVIRPWYSFDIKAVQIFTVVGLLDLNLSPKPILGITGSPQESFFVEESTDICCLFCASGPVVMGVSLPRTGFVPGERIPFSVEMTNSSRQSFKTCVCYFVQKCTMIATGSSRVVENVVRTVEGVLLRPGETETWRNEELLVPPLPPTRLGGAKVINVRYILKFEVTFRGLGDFLKTEVPIVIGTVPVRSAFEELTPNTWKGKSNELQAFEPVSPVFDLFETYPDFPPHKFIRSAVHWSKIFDHEKEATPVEQESDDVKKYHPLCIYFETQHKI